MHRFSDIQFVLFLFYVDSIKDIYFLNQFDDLLHNFSLKTCRKSQLQGKLSLPPNSIRNQTLQFLRVNNTKKKQKRNLNEVVTNKQPKGKEVA